MMVTLDPFPVLMPAGDLEMNLCMCVNFGFIECNCIIICLCVFVG